MREPGHIENGVMFGRDGYLFLVDGGHRVLDLILGLRNVPDASFTNFGSNLNRRAALCDAADVGFLHVVVPDKQSVMIDAFPIEGPLCLTDIYAEKVPDIRQWLCYPREDLQSAPAPPFMRTDTHLSDVGNIVVARAIVERLTGTDQAAQVERLMNSDNWTETEWVGDLGGRFEPKLAEMRRRVTINCPFKLYSNEMNGGNNGITNIIFNPSALLQKRLLIFGDSFMGAVARTLFLFFEEIVFLRTPFFHDDIFEQIEPDFVVTSNAERYLSYCDSDENRPSFFMYPYFRTTNFRADEKFAQAFSAVLSHGRQPYRDFLRKEGLQSLIRDP